MEINLEDLEEETEIEIPKGHTIAVCSKCERFLGFCPIEYDDEGVAYVACPNEGRC